MIKIKYIFISVLLSIVLVGCETTSISLPKDISQKIWERDYKVIEMMLNHTKNKTLLTNEEKSGILKDFVEGNGDDLKNATLTENEKQLNKEVMNIVLQYALYNDNLQNNSPDINEQGKVIKTMINNLIEKYK